MTAHLSSSGEPLSAAELFDSVGSAYEPAFANPRQDQAVSWLIEQLKDKVNAKILDIGSGTGRPVCSSLADAGHDVVGIDVSPVMVKHAQNAVPNARFEVANALHYDIADETFDAITAMFSLIASLSQDDIRQILKAIHGWLKPGGIFVFSTVPMPSNLEKITWMGRKIIVSSLTTEDVLTTLTKVGFNILDKDENTFDPKAVEAGICKEDEIWPEPHLWVQAQKSL